MNAERKGGKHHSDVTSTTKRGIHAADSRPARRHDGAAKASSTRAEAVANAFAERATRRWRVAETIYSAEELAILPTSAVDSALGLGHPVRDARLRAGEVVLDIGCGTGIDVLLAAPVVADAGRVIGLDLSGDLIGKASQHAAASGLTNVDFLVAPMEDIPLPDASVDVVISNGVINLSTDKDRAFSEAYRVLRPGGRMVAADMLLVADLPPTVLDNPKLWSG
jgi:SAM-dependent methyltransferase